MKLLLIAKRDDDCYVSGEVVAKYDMTDVMDINMGQHRISIRIFDPTQIGRPWEIHEYPRSSIKLIFDGANTGTYNFMLWTNRNRKGLS